MLAKKELDKQLRLKESTQHCDPASSSGWLWEPASVSQGAGRSQSRGLYPEGSRWSLEVTGSNVGTRKISMGVGTVSYCFQSQARYPSDWALAQPE